MSYASRVYRQRNPKSNDETKEKSFFPKGKQNTQGKGSFFRAKKEITNAGGAAEQEADRVANAAIHQPAGKMAIQKKEGVVQRLATTSEEEIDSSNDSRMERDKEKPFQRKPIEPEKEKEKSLQKKDEPDKEKEKMMQKKAEPDDKDKLIQKPEDPLKEKDKKIQKKTEPEKDKDKQVRKNG